MILPALATAAALAVGVVFGGTVGLVVALITNRVESRRFNRHTQAALDVARGPVDAAILRHPAGKARA